jgi:hypothetical protein
MVNNLHAITPLVPILQFRFLNIDFMKQKLQELLEQNQGNITEEVIKEAMDYHNPKDFFEDLLSYGCQS